MPKPFRQRSLESEFELANIQFPLDRQGWITFLAALLLALITLFAGYDHVDLLGAASIDLPQQAGIPCLFAAVATAFAEAQLAFNDRQRSEAIPARAERNPDLGCVFWGQDHQRLMLVRLLQKSSDG